MLFSVCANMLGSVNKLLDFHPYSFVCLKRFSVLKCMERYQMTPKGVECVYNPPPLFFFKETFSFTGSVTVWSNWYFGFNYPENLSIKERIKNNNIISNNLSSALVCILFISIHCQPKFLYCKGCTINVL